MGAGTHGASCFQRRALVHLKVFSGYSSPFLCVSFSAFLTSLPPLSFLPSQSKLGSEGPHMDPMDSPSLKSGGPTFNRTLTPRKAGMGKEQGTCVTAPNQRAIPPTPHCPPPWTELRGRGVEPPTYHPHSDGPGGRPPLQGQASSSRRSRGSWYPAVGKDGVLLLETLWEHPF